MTAALIIAYHAIESGPPPLCVAPAQFESHLDALTEAGARCMTVSKLAAALRGNAVPERAVALTFDDGFASVAEFAAPALSARGLPATVFCVAGHLGAINDWHTQPPGTHRASLMGRAELRELASAGFEIGAHGMRHIPLRDISTDVMIDEIVGSKRILEEVTGRSVTSFAFPYGEVPDRTALAAVQQHFDVAVAGGTARVAAGHNLYALPRVDSHYLRARWILRGVLTDRLDAYLAIRRIGARLRRTVKRDYARGP